MRGGLRRAGGRVALDARVGLRDHRLDEGRQLDVDRLAAPEDHVDVQVLLQVGARVAHLLGRERDLLVALRVHEHELIAVLVDVLHLALLDVGLVERLAGAEGAVEHATGAQVLQLGAHERAALAGLHVLEVDHHERLAVELDLEAVAEARGIDRHAGLSVKRAGSVAARSGGCCDYFATAIDGGSVLGSNGPEDESRAGWRRATAGAAAARRGSPPARAARGCRARRPDAAPPPR